MDNKRLFKITVAVNVGTPEPRIDEILIAGDAMQAGYVIDWERFVNDWYRSDATNGNIEVRAITYIGNVWVVPDAEDAK